jgi:flagellar motility protein MotE (MotC chaperone)
MKLVIIAGALAFLLSIGATMFFTGTFKKNNPQTVEEALPDQKIKQKIEQPTTKSVEKPISANNVNNVAKTENTVNNNGTKSLEMQAEKYKAEVSAEEAKLASVKSDVESAKTTKSSTVKYQQLGKLYSSMKAEDAATVLCELEPSMTEHILCAMNDRNAGKVMSSIASKNPTYAAKVSKLIANVEDKSPSEF